MLLCSSLFSSLVSCYFGSRCCLCSVGDGGCCYGFGDAAAVTIIFVIGYYFSCSCGGDDCVAAVIAADAVNVTVAVAD